MKTARFVCIIVGASLVFAGVVCLVFGYWEALGELAESIGERFRRNNCKDFVD